MDKEVKDLIFDENDDGVLDNIVEHKRDNNGNVTEVHLDFDNDGIVDTIVYYEYDENGNIIKKSVDKKANGKINSIEIYEFDENGNIITYYDDNADGKVDYTSYTDENGEIKIEDNRSTAQKIKERLHFIFLT